MRRSAALGLMRCVALLLTAALASTALAEDSAKKLRLAARQGDLDEVKRLVAAGVPVDEGDHYGTTALLLAAGQGKTEVVRFLLDHGANPSAREGFFNTSVLESALSHEPPFVEVAKMVLAAGAEDRATAIAMGLESGNTEIAQAAIESGPVLESEAADLRQQLGGKEGAAAILEKLKTKPDPPPPAYTSEQLKPFSGRFENSDGTVAEVATAEKGLVVTVAGASTPVAATAERVFRNADAGVTLQYYGRAGTIEGVMLERRGQEPLRLRVGDAPIVAKARPALEAGGKSSASATKTVNWPGFRGENRSGVGDGAEPPVEFDLATGRGVAWKADLPGLGNSSPVVWGDRVYVTTAVAAGGSKPLKTGLTGSGEEVEENVEHRWLVLAFDKASGKKIWETEVGRGVPLTKRHFKATQANSTPFTDGEHVVVVFPTAGLACLSSKDGAVRWKQDLGGLNAGGFNDPGLQWGFAASPIIYKGKVILQVDIHDGPYLAAWDLESGKPLWKTERPDVAPSWATPAVWSNPAGDELVVNASVIRGYDPGTGKELWSLGPTSIQVVASPVTGQDNVLFVSSGYPPARPIYAVKPGIRGKHEVYSAEDAAAASLVWRDERGGAYMPTPLFYRDVLYVVHHNGRVVAHDARTGERVAQARFSKGGTCTASPVVANGKIYQGTEEGTLYVIGTAPELKELFVADFGEPLMATPAISEGLLLVRTPSKLIALRKPAN
jgi:outer membrane protein assembly factor BamB